jgi:hypothetical protein
MRIKNGRPGGPGWEEPKGPTIYAEVAKMVGHTDLKMIERRYGHLYESELRKKFDRLGAEV